MKRRRITLADGRYLIFYTFEDETPARTPLDEESAERSAPESLPATRQEEKPDV
jgi:hypothetical protein